MTLDEELRLSYYKRISPLNSEHGVWLVQHVENKRVYVQKRLTTYDVRVFRRLIAEPVPYIPRIYEAVEDNGALIVIEQYIDGVPLSAVLEERGKLGVDEALSYAKQIAAALGCLHGMTPPIIHRDIKPSNVIISDEGQIALIDFDAAKHQKAGESRDTQLIGTAGYAAPEQFGFGASGPATDIYSLGVLLNEMLTGSSSLKDIPGGKLGRIIRKCTKINPDSRYSSADRLLRDLNSVGGNSVRFEEKELKRSYLPFGFRTLTPWKMILAVIGYACIFGILTFSSWVGVYGAKLWFYRILLFVTVFIMIQFPANVCGVLDKLGISRIKLTWLRVTVIVLFDIFIFILMIVLLSGDPALAA